MSTNNSNTVQAFWVMLGSLSAFGFVMVSSMLLSRYFDKSDYGTYKQVMYVYSSLIAIFTLGLPRAFSYFLPRVNKGQAKDLISKINLLLMSLGAVMSLCLFFGADLISGFLKNSELATPLRYFAIVPFLMLPTMGIEGILATFKQTKFLAVYRVLTQLFMLLCVVIPVIFFEGTLISAIIGFSIASFLCFLSAIYFNNRPLKGYVKEKSPYSYRQIFDYALPIMGASIWGIIISSSDQFFISRYFGTEVFAEFANGSMELPFVGMIIGATSVVLSPVFSKLTHENINPQKHIFPLWKSVFEKSAKLIYPLVIFAWFFADVLMVILYGQQYENSSVYFRIKVVINFFTIILYAPLLINIGKVKYYANVHMITAIVLVLMSFLVVQTFDSPYYISIVSLLCQIGKTFALLYAVAKFFQLKVYQLFPVELILKIVLPSIIILSLEYYLFVIYFDLKLIVALVVSFILYAFFFLLYTIWIEIDYLSIFKPLIKKNNN